MTARSQLLFTVVAMCSILVLSSSAAKAQAKKNRGQQVPDGVTAHRDLEYAKAADKKLLLDIYVPDAEGESRTADASDVAESLPLIVWIHGGAWRGGNKRHCPALPYTTKGYVAASISYRLSHEAIFPAQIEDCKAAIRWLRANAATYRIDPDRIGVWGSSAGGHLVAMLGTTGDVKELETQHGNLDQSSRVQAVCDFFGPTDFLRMDADALPGGPIVHDDPKSPESLLIGAPIQDYPDKVARANPITYVTIDDPPFLIVHGNKDPLVPWQQSKYLHEAMQTAGLKDVKFEIVEGAGHGFRRSEQVAKMVETFFTAKLAKREIRRD